MYLVHFTFDIHYRFYLVKLCGPFILKRHVATSQNWGKKKPYVQCFEIKMGFIKMKLSTCKIAHES
jgi:hypothetical protein